MAVMYIWEKQDKSWGHTSLSLNDDSAYISWWPTKEKSKSNLKKKKTEGRSKELLPVDYIDERDNFTGREYNYRFFIRETVINKEKIRKWWEKIKDKGGYHFLFNNCCDAVVQALREGGIEIGMSLIRTPDDMVGLGRKLYWKF